MTLTIKDLKDYIAQWESYGADDSTQVWLEDNDSELYPLEIIFNELVTPEALKLETIKRNKIEKPIIVIEILG